jgi:tetratricopeptide (TPR) repeat protein
VAWQLGRYEQATSLLLREYKSTDGLSRTEAAQLELGLAAVALRTSDIPTATDWSEQALRTLAPGGDPMQTTTAHGQLALAHTVAGDTERADHHLTQVLETLEDTDDERLAPHIDLLAVTGWTQMFLERHDAALQHLGRGLRLCRRTGHTTMLADLFAASAYVLLALGAPGRGGGPHGGSVRCGFPGRQR